MKILKKLGIVAVVLLMCIVLTVILLILGEHQWQADVKPLSLEEIERLASVAVSDTHDNNEEQREESANTPEQSTHVNLSAPEHKITDEAEGHTVDPAAGEAVEQPGSDANGPNVFRDEPEDAELHPPPQAGLASRPEEEQLLKRFSQQRDFERTKTKAGLFLLRVVGFAVCKIRQDATDPWTCSIPGQIGRLKLHVGDFDTARSYLSEAMRVEKDEPWRRVLACHLAWIEEDPQVAVALLEQSLAGPLGGVTDPSFLEGYAEFNALDLCVATGSEELANDYYQRYRDSWRQWLEKDRRTWFSETLTWIQEREATIHSK